MVGLVPNIGRSVSKNQGEIMTKLTGAALDRAVAQAMGLKSVNNCAAWGKSVIYHKDGTWTQQDMNDFEDCVDMQRFEKKGDRIFVKYPRKESK
jgi:hypothetical protein